MKFHQNQCSKSFKNKFSIHISPLKKSAKLLFSFSISLKSHISWITSSTGVTLSFNFVKLFNNFQSHLKKKKK
jgi:hypothetical protein